MGISRKETRGRSGGYQVAKPFDADGRLAASGTADEALLAKLLAHPFFALPPPKSLDRDAFAALMPDAQAFAFLAARAAERKPISYPLTTGVPKPLTGGRISRLGTTG
jgi:anhydro-N-acetylmuramic acid kinase